MKQLRAGFHYCLLTGVVLLACNTSKNWSGSDLPGNNSASFNDLKGTQKFKLLLARKGPFFIKYRVIVQKGQLTLTVKSPAATIFQKQITSEAADSVAVPLALSETYYVIIKGENASGNFNIAYGLLQPE